jgi:hypothetical protein
MWNNHGDELVDEAEYQATAAKLDSLGYRYELDAYQPCANPGCSPLFPNHLQLAINDQFAPAAAFLGSARVDRNPAHVTYVVDTARSHANLGLVGNHAYWVSGLKLRDPSQTGTSGDPQGQIDALSSGLGRGDPPASLTQPGAGTLTGGRFGTLTFTSEKKTWGPPPPGPVFDRISITATNVGSAQVDVARAHVSCSVNLQITSDGPIAVRLPGCNRTVHGG